ncbi:MAG: hypothetical protein V4506_15585 [Bacteroidota bacterium]
MAYISPLHIIKGIANDATFEINDVNLIRLRKKLLAELNLSGETTITVNKKSYSKDEIIKTIDQLLGNPDLELHEFIFKHTFLLRYLEEEGMVLSPQNYSGIDIPESLKPKLEGLMYERIIVQFKKGISSRAFSHAQSALGLMQPLPVHLRELCYEEVHKSLYTLNTFLYEIEANMTLQNKNDIKFLGYESFAHFVNALPIEFEDIKYDLVNRAINIVVGYHKLSRHDKDLVEDISTVLTKINCVEEQASLIRNNHRIFTSKGSSSSSSSSSGYGPLKYIGIAVIILINILRVCNKSNSHDYSYNNPQYDFSNLSIPSSTKAYSLSEEFTLYKTALYSRKQDSKDQVLNTIFFDTLYDVPQQPFEQGFKWRKDSTLFSWDRDLQIKNNTDLNLIVFCFDSARTAMSTTYIKQHESTTIKFGNRVRLAFYFGNVLMQSKQMGTMSENAPAFYEYFSGSNAKELDLLNTTYQILLKQPKSKKKTGCVLTLDPDFIEAKSDLWKFKKFDLVGVYD